MARTKHDERPHEIDDVDETRSTVHPQREQAAGVEAVAVSTARALREAGPVRTARSWLKLNQVGGFDCMSCAWPDPEPGHRHPAEFCENGAKAVAEETTRVRCDPDFFARHSIEELDQHSEWWLGQQGRITHPMVRWAGDTHYRPIAWQDAYDLVGRTLRDLDSPDQAVFYTSGRASNEVAFAYQLFARAFGTNNLPDCSNMCHESTSIALAESIGIGKASVTMRDLYDADLIVIAGQNPGTNHPRMLTHLETAKRRGAKILAINPLREAGLVRFHNPQTPRGVVGPGTEIADLHLPVRTNGDLALFQAIGSLLVEWDAIDHPFVERFTHDYEAWAAHVRDVDWDQVVALTGLTREQITEAARMIAASRATVWCWAMGLTQHHNSVATIKEVVNLAGARGDIGKRGAGVFPVRGHSNVQGDRTMGIWERVSDSFLDKLGAEFGFEPPREHGHDTVDSVRALRDGDATVFVGLGGNFVQAAPDTEVTAAAMRRARLTVQLSTKLNRSHLACGHTALILPVRGRTEKDVQGGVEQFVSVEDSTCSVHASRGPLEPASPYLRSEVQIVCEMAEATLEGRHDLPWREMREDYGVIRRHISRVVEGCESYVTSVDRPGGFILPHPPRDSRTFETPSGRLEMAVSPIEALQVPPDHLILQTIRSHDQFNTTIYGHSDRYRGIEGGRRVVFCHRDDIARLGLEAGDHVDLRTHWEGDEVERCAPNFRVVEYDIPRGCIAAYYPETNPLVPLDSTAVGSNCPTSKSIVVRLNPATSRTVSPPPGQGDARGQDPLHSDDSHKSHPQPRHLS